MLAATIAMILANSAAAATELELTSGPITMTGSQIREYNSHLDRDHPNYIRCTRVEETGSLVRKRAVCRTNQQWAIADEAGNREARDISETMRSKATAGE